MIGYHPLYSRITGSNNVLPKTGMNESKYLEFEWQGTSGKTDRWIVSNKHHGHLLGIIKWYGPWRQYCFSPEGDVVFNPGCMDDISNFIKKRMKERK